MWRSLWRSTLPEQASPAFPSGANEPSRVGQALLEWFAAQQRDLPWRRDVTPYRVLVSEIMLQQTTVATVAPRFEKFLERFPTIQHLATADDAVLLEAWSGLGYYRRARLLRETARALELRGGEWPRTAAELQRLPGIGAYTSGAVASIAFGEAAPAIDTNVRRVMGRFLDAPDAGDARYHQAVLALMAGAEHPGNINQALMEVGATICTPRAAHCGRCPLRIACATAGTRCGKAGQLELLEAPLLYGTTKPRKPATPRADCALALLAMPPEQPAELLLWRRPLTPPGVYGGMIEWPTWRGEDMAAQAPCSSQEMAWPQARAWFQHQLGDAVPLPAGDATPLHVIRHTITRYRVDLGLYVQILRHGMPGLSPVTPDGFELQVIALESAPELPASPQRRLMQAVLSHLALARRRPNPRHRDA